MGRPGQKVIGDEDALAERISLGLLARAFPRATVEAVVEAANAREQRTRMLPSWLVVYYVLAQMIILGVVLLVVGFVTGIPALVTIGGILLVIGVILWILGAMGRAVGGRKHYY